MKLATVLWPDGDARPAAILSSGRLIDLARLPLDARRGDRPSIATMLTLIEHWPIIREELVSKVYAFKPDETIPVDDVTLLAPIPLPPQIRDFSCFEQHVIGARAGFRRLAGAAPQSGPDEVLALWRSQPLYYKCNRFAVTGPDTTVQWPAASSVMDYELELAMIISKPGKNITAADAGGHVFGYTIFNDFTARDLQLHEMAGTLGPTKSKDFDRANAIGPWIVTSDELTDPGGLAMVARVNGEERSRGCSKDMHWTFEQLIEHASRDETLHVGEILGSGTVSGGCGLETSQFLEDGDIVELEIEGIGVLRNRVSR